MSRDAPSRRPVAVPFLGGDLAQRRLSQGQRLLAERMGVQGLLATPRMSMNEIVGWQGSGGSGQRPMRIVLTEGTWAFDSAGFSTNREGLRFTALVPGETVFRRSVSGASTGPMVSFTGTDCSLEGIQFDDTSTGQPAIRLGARFGVVRACIFVDCWRAIRIHGNHSRVRDSYIADSRDTSYAIYASAGNFTSVRDTHTLATDAGTLIRADGGINFSTFYGNQAPSSVTYVVDYLRTGTENDAAANTPRSKVNAR